MSSALKRQLYNFVSGFKNDKDEEWACYLPAKDAKFLQTTRKRFLVMMDQLDELKLELKDNTGNSQRAGDLSNKIKETTKQIDEYIKTVLKTIPELKARGTKAREDRIASDLGADRPGHSSTNASTLEIESEMLGCNFDAFMPRTDIFEPNPQPARQEEVSQASSDDEQMDADDTPDTYLDGIEEENIEIMEKLRSLTQRFKCRDHVLQALKRFRHREDRLLALENLRELDQSRKKKALVPVDNG